MRLARLIASMDLRKWLRDQYAEHGLLPDLFDRITPHQFEFLFLSNPTSQDASVDPVEATRISNDRRGQQGLPPVVPFWMFAAKNKKAKRK